MSSWQKDKPKIDVCVEDETIVYLNRKDVQKALHSRLVGVNQWTVCSEYFILPLSAQIIKKKKFTHLRLILKQ